MKKQKIWACVTRAGLIARDNEGWLVAAQTHDALKILLSNIDVQEGRWTIRRLEIKIPD